MKQSGWTLLIVLGLVSAPTRLPFAAPSSEQDLAKMPMPKPEMMISSPRPEYPYYSRANHHEGAGLFVLTINRDGSVARVTVKKSIGYPELDASAVKAFSKWRFKPGTAKYVKMPLTFEMNRPGSWRLHRDGHASGYD